MVRLPVISETDAQELYSDHSAGALSVDNLKRIVVDASHIDQKKRGVMDMKETMVPLAKWLARKEFKERYTDSDNQVELMFY